jgi:hypothetical protein
MMLSANPTNPGTLTQAQTSATGRTSQTNPLEKVSAKEGPSITRDATVRSGLGFRPKLDQTGPQFSPGLGLVQQFA